MIDKEKKARFSLQMNAHLYASSESAYTLFGGGCGTGLGDNPQPQRNQARYIARAFLTFPFPLSAFLSNLTVKPFYIYILCNSFSLSSQPTDLTSVSPLLRSHRPSRQEPRL